MSKVNWEEILTVAARLFCEKGYVATTMDDIAAELDITKPALYYYIKTKHDLLYEICESAINQLMDGVSEIVASTQNPEDKLREIIKLHVNMFSKNGDITNVYLADESKLPPAKRSHIRSLSREYESIYRDILKKGTEDEAFRQVDVPMVVRAISGMCNWLSSWYRPDGELSADEIAEVFIDLVLYGCKKQKRQSRSLT